MDAAAVASYLSTLDESASLPAVPAAARAAAVRDVAGGATTLGALLDARPRAILVLGRNLL